MVYFQTFRRCAIIGIILHSTHTPRSISFWLYFCETWEFGGIVSHTAAGSRIFLKAVLSALSKRAQALEVLDCIVSQKHEHPTGDVLLGELAMAQNGQLSSFVFDADAPGIQTRVAAGNESAHSSRKRVDIQARGLRGVWLRNWDVVVVEDQVSAQEMRYFL